MKHPWHAMTGSSWSVLRSFIKSDLLQ